MPDQGDALARRDGERNVLQDPIVLLISEPDVAELDMPLDLAAFLRLRRALDVDLQIEQDKNTVRRHDRRSRQ